LILSACHHSSNPNPNFSQPGGAGRRLAIFLHEVGHHAIGFNRYRTRCEEEYHVWVWAINQMRQIGIEPDTRVARRFQLSMQYAVGKALRRGLKRLPEPLMQFVPKAA
jgi:hypothetical protein